MFEVEADGRVVDHDGALDHRELCVEHRRGLRTRQRIERIFDVGGGDRIAVRKTRGRVDVEGCRTQVGRDFHVVRYERVLGGQLVPTALHQRVEHQTPDVGCGRAAYEKRIQRIVALQLVVVLEA